MLSHLRAVIPLRMGGESVPEKIERLERYRAQGFFHFILWEMVLKVGLPFSVGIAFVLGFTTGFSFGWRLMMCGLFILPYVLVAGILVWIYLPHSLEYWREREPARLALRKEANALFVCGWVITFLSSIIPFHLGSDFAAADIMMIVTGAVIGTWGLIKWRRYCRESPGWPALGFMQRALRVDVYVILFALSVAAMAARAGYFYYDVQGAVWLRTIAP